MGAEKAFVCAELPRFFDSKVQACDFVRDIIVCQSRCRDMFAPVAAPFIGDAGGYCLFLHVPREACSPVVGI